MLTDELTDLAGLARAERAAGDKAARDANQERDDLAWLMSGPRGRRIVWRQIDRAGVLTGSSFSPDAMTMAFLRASGTRRCDCWVWCCRWMSSR